MNFLKRKYYILVENPYIFYLFRQIAISLGRYFVNGLLHGGAIEKPSR